MSIAWRTPSRADEGLTAGTLALVAGLSGLAGGIHLSVAPEHFDEWWGYGVFFLLAALGEGALVVALAVRPRAWVVHAGIWGSLLTMLMYLVSRTSGIPLGPAEGAVEAVELPGITATVAEGAIVIVLCRLLGGRERRRTLNALGLVGVALWVAALAGALAPSEQPVAHAHGGEEAGAVHHHDMGVPFIPESVRNAPRPSGDG